MQFNSLSFAIFLPTIFILYWFATKGNLRLQNILLLLASYFFYAVEFIFFPYPPKVYDRIQKNYPLVLRTESMVKEFAKLQQITCYGSFSPFLLGMDKTFFYDGMHMKEIGIDKTLKFKN